MQDKTDPDALLNGGPAGAIELSEEDVDAVVGGAAPVKLLTDVNDIVYSSPSADKRPSTADKNREAMMNYVKG